MISSKRAFLGALSSLLFWPVFAGYFLLHREPPPEADLGYMVAVGGAAAFTFISKGWSVGLSALLLDRVGSGSLQSVPFGLAWMLTGGSDMESRLMVQLPVLFLFGFFVWRSFSIRLSPWRALGATAFLLSFPFLAREAVMFEHLPFLAFGTMALYFLWRSEFFTRPWALLGAFAGVAGAMAHRVPETLVYLLPLIGLYVIEAARRRHLRTRDVLDVSLASALIFSVLVYRSGFFFIESADFVVSLLGAIGILWEIGRRRGVPAGLRNFVAAVLAFAVVAFAPFASDVFLWLGLSLFSRWVGPAWSAHPESSSIIARYLEFFGGAAVLIIPALAIVLAWKSRSRWARLIGAMSPVLLGGLLGFGAAHYFIAPVLLVLGLSAFEILRARSSIALAGGLAMGAIVFWNVGMNVRWMQETLKRPPSPPLVFEQISKRLAGEGQELRLGLAGGLNGPRVDANALWLSALRQGRNWHFIEISTMDLGTGMGTSTEWEACFDKELDYVILLRSPTDSSEALGGPNDLFTDLRHDKASGKLERFAQVDLGEGSRMEIFKGHVPPGTIERAGGYFGSCGVIWDKYQPPSFWGFMWKITQRHGVLRDTPGL